MGTMATIVCLVVLLLLVLNVILAPFNPYAGKNNPFECGFLSFLWQNRVQFSIAFFLFALLFLLFDLEVLLVFPYFVSAYVNQIQGLISMILFLLVLVAGFGFEYGRKALTINSKQLQIAYAGIDKNHNNSYVSVANSETHISPTRAKSSICGYSAAVFLVVFIVLIIPAYQRMKDCSIKKILIKHINWSNLMLGLAFLSIRTLLIFSQTFEVILAYLECYSETLSDILSWTVPGFIILFFKLCLHLNFESPFAEKLTNKDGITYINNPKGRNPTFELAAFQDDPTVDEHEVKKLHDHLLILKDSSKEEINAFINNVLYNNLLFVSSFFSGLMKKHDILKDYWAAQYKTRPDVPDFNDLLRRYGLNRFKDYQSITNVSSALHKTRDMSFVYAANLDMTRLYLNDPSISFSVWEPSNFILDSAPIWLPQFSFNVSLAIKGYLYNLRLMEIFSDRIFNCQSSFHIIFEITKKYVAAEMANMDSKNKDNGVLYTYFNTLAHQNNRLEVIDAIFGADLTCNTKLQEIKKMQEGKKLMAKISKLGLDPDAEFIRMLTDGTLQFVIKDMIENKIKTFKGLDKYFPQTNVNISANTAEPSSLSTTEQTESGSQNVPSSSMPTEVHNAQETINNSPILQQVYNTNTTPDFSTNNTNRNRSLSPAFERLLHDRLTDFNNEHDKNVLGKRTRSETPSSEGREGSEKRVKRS